MAATPPAARACRWISMCCCMASKWGDFDGLILPRAEILKNAFVLWPLALHAPQVLHPGVQRSFADLWQTAQIAQQLQPIAFQWRGHELTPAPLLLDYPTPL